MNVNQTMHQANLSKWTALFHEQRQSGLTIKDWCSQNNVAEQAIRPFTIGRKNWVCANSIHGASASAILYSIVETQKPMASKFTTTSNSC